MYPELPVPEKVESEPAHTSDSPVVNTNVYRVSIQEVGGVVIQVVGVVTQVVGSLPHMCEFLHRYTRRMGLWFPSTKLTIFMHLKYIGT